MSLQTFGPLICFEKNREELRLLFTSGLMSTLLKLLGLLVMSQTRLEKKESASKSPEERLFSVFKSDQGKLQSSS